MDIVMPQLGETVAEGTIARWLKRVGDAIERDEPLFEVETEKVATEIPAPVTGVLVEVLVEEGETVDVGARLAIISEEGAATTGANSGSTGSEKPAPTRMRSSGRSDARKSESKAESSSAVKHRLSPAVRKLLEENQLEPSDVPLSTPGARLTKKDVLTYLERQSGASGASATSPAATGSEGEVIPFDRVRKLTAEHMVRSKQVSPHVYQGIEGDFEAVEAVRSKYRRQWREEHGATLTYLPFIARAVVMTLKEFPRLNASVNSDQLLLHTHVNLAIAIDLGLVGLVAPVIREAEMLSVPQLARCIADLAMRARSNALKQVELEGGTYTITNSGSFGTAFTAPIINQPQVAILSTDAVSRKPVVKTENEVEQIVIHPIGMLVQSFDHRAVDGAYSAAFLRQLKETLQGYNWMDEFSQ